MLADGAGLLASDEEDDVAAGVVEVLSEVDEPSVLDALPFSDELAEPPLPEEPFL